MRWKAEPPSAEMPLWIWLLVPIWGPVAALALTVGGLAFGTLWCKRRLVGPTERWRPWFAWYPVSVGYWTEDDWPAEQRVWLEWIERRAGHLLGDAVHRLPATQPAPPTGDRADV